MSVKLTEPDGVVEPEAALTVAVSFTVLPVVTEDGEATSVVLVFTLLVPALITSLTVLDVEALSELSPL